MRRISRILAFLFTNLSFLLLTIIVGVIFLPFGTKVHRKVTTFFVPVWSNIIIFLLGIKVKVKNPELMKKGQNYFIVGNHLSYLDVIIVGSFIPVLFVAKKEVKSWPLLGTMAWFGGMLFIDRSKKGTANRPYVDQITKQLRDGFHISIFPEGTSTNGDTVLPFKKTIFSCPVNARIPILPISIRYVSINNTPFGPENRDLVCWYGNMNFIDHFWKLLALKEFSVEISIHPPIFEEQQEDWVEQNRQLAERLYEIVKNGYHEKT